MSHGKKKEKPGEEGFWFQSFHISQSCQSAAAGCCEAKSPDLFVFFLFYSDKKKKKYMSFSCQKDKV